MPIEFRVPVVLIKKFLKSFEIRHISKTTTHTLDDWFSFIVKSFGLVKLRRIACHFFWRRLSLTLSCTETPWRWFKIKEGPVVGIFQEPWKVQNIFLLIFSQGVLTIDVLQVYFRRTDYESRYCFVKALCDVPPTGPARGDLFRPRWVVRGLMAGHYPAAHLSPGRALGAVVQSKYSAHLLCFTHRGYSSPLQNKLNRTKISRQKYF